MPQHDDPFNANCIQTTKIVSLSNVDAQPVGRAVQTLENIQPRRGHQSDYIKTHLNDKIKTQMWKWTRNKRCG